METSTEDCTKDVSCLIHSHTEDLAQSASYAAQQSTTDPNVSTGVAGAKLEVTQAATPDYDPDDRGFRRIIRNFTPS